MKYSRKATLTVLAAAALFCAAPMRAQRASTRFEIPFAFVAGSEMYPAGVYEFTYDPFARILVRAITESTTHVVPLAAKYESRPMASIEKSRLRFQQYGGTMFLTVVWAAGHEDGRAVAVSPRLIEARNTTADPSKPGTVALESDQK